MNLSIIHEDIYSVIHKMCHPKSYHSDIEYDMTLNITLGVMFSFPKLTSPNTKAASSMQKKDN